VPTSRQLRDAVAAGGEAGRNLSRAFILIAAVAAVALARGMQWYFGWGFWPTVIGSGLLVGIAVGVAEGVRMLRANRP
jgi:hypothetical protein